MELFVWGEKLNLCPCEPSRRMADPASMPSPSSASKPTQSTLALPLGELSAQPTERAVSAMADPFPSSWKRIGLLHFTTPPATLLMYLRLTAKTINGNHYSALK